MMAGSLRVVLLLTVTTRIFAQVAAQHGYGLEQYEHTQQSRGYAAPIAAAENPITNIFAPPPQAPMTGGITPTAKPNCNMQIPTACVFPFTYKGLSYTTCTGVDAVGKMWCSETKAFGGQWAECKNPCVNKWPAKRIASTVVAGSVAATGLGLIIAAVAEDEAKHQHHHHHNNPFKDLVDKLSGNRKLGEAPTGEMNAIQSGKSSLLSTASIVDAPVIV